MKRASLVGLLSLWLLVGSVILYARIDAEAEEALRGYENPTQQADLPFRVPRFGVNVELTQYAPEALEAHFALMRAVGVHWVRQHVRWDSIEQVQGVYDWSAYDRVFDALQAQETLEPVVVLFGTPTWARQANTSTFAPPVATGAWEAFLNAFVARYGQTIRYYQIWDEPNLHDAWGHLPPNPTRYLDLLQQAYLTIKAQDADAVVISASLAMTTENDHDTTSDWVYLDQLYRLGLREVSDAIGGKAYGFASSPHDRTIRDDVLNFSRVVRLREIMRAYGDSKKALWITHFGWNSLPSDWQGEASIWRQVTQAEQTRYTQEALERVNQEWAWLGGMILHQWQPQEDQTSAQWGFAVLAPDNAPTPLYEALASYHAKMPPLPQNGLYHPRQLNIAYSGVWTLSELGVDIGWIETTDSKLKLTFWGKDVSLLAREGDYVAFLYPTVDGRPANALPSDNLGHSYLFLRSASLLPEVNNVLLHTGSTVRSRELHITADKGWGQWAIAGFGFSDADLALPYRMQKQVAILAIGVSVLAVLVALSQLTWQTSLQRLLKATQMWNTRMQYGIAALTSVILMLGMFITWGDGSPNILRKEAYALGLATLLSGGLVALELSFVVVIVALAVLWLIFYNHPRVGLALVIFWSPFFLFPVELYRFAFPIAELLILLLFSAWLVERAVTLARAYRLGAQLVWRWSVMDGLMLLWLIWGLLSITWASYRAEAITEWRTLILEPVLFYAVSRTAIKTHQQISQLLLSLVLSGIIVCLIGLWTFVTGQGVITAEEGTWRLVSVYGSPNNVALWLGRCIPLVLAIALSSKGTGRWWAGSALVLMVGTMGLTQSVGGLFVGLPAGVAGVLLVLYGKRALTPLAGLLGVSIAGGWVLAQTSARFAKLLALDEGTNFLRLRVWESAIELITKTPLTGVGLDQFLYAYRASFVRPDAIWDMDLSHPHQIVLDLWLRLGVFGLLIFGLMQWAFWRTWRTLNASSHDLQRALKAGLAGCMLAVLAHGMIDNSLFVFDLAFAYVLCLAVVVQWHAIDVDEKG
jgi:O-antigen ligase